MANKIIILLLTPAQIMSINNANYPFIPQPPAGKAHANIRLQTLVKHGSWTPYVTNTGGTPILFFINSDTPTLFKDSVTLGATDEQWIDVNGLFVELPFTTTEVSIMTNNGINNGDFPVTFIATYDEVTIS